MQGKAFVNTGFGSKIAISMMDGYVRIEHFLLENFNEALTEYSSPIVHAFR